MGKIPIVKKPYPDELLYSWICRLAYANGLSISAFSDAYLGRQNTEDTPLTWDIRNEFFLLYNSIYTTSDLINFYLDLTTFGYESIWMTRGQQTRYTNYVFRKQDKLNPFATTLFQSVNICPACFSEDIEKFGEPYLHRSHQLSGIMTCHKHKNKLRDHNDNENRNTQGSFGYENSSHCRTRNTL